MSYTPTNWQTGDTITAEKLNNMEDGIEKASNPFIVTLTPTALDYSGTMDKTVGEINAAYEAGKDILFRVLTSANYYVDVPMSFASELGYAFKDFGATIILPSQNVMIAAETLATDDGTKRTYSTAVYPLTPMS